MNARRFPRSLSDAFPSERYAAVQHFPRPLSARVWDWLFVSVLSAASGLGIALYLSR
jgi:hypothetical protein